MFTNLQYGGTMPFAKTWRCADRVFDLSSRPLIMGILNVTPDSFSDGGDHNKLNDAVAWARRMAAHGADIIDVGGESTRPGSSPVSLEEESRRVLPVVEALAAEGFVVSVDTSRPEIMTAAAKAGAKILNDVRGFDLTGAAEAAAATDCGLVVMHGFDADRTLLRPFMTIWPNARPRFVSSAYRQIASAGIRDLGSARRWKAILN